MWTLICVNSQNTGNISSKKSNAIELKKKLNNSWSAMIKSHTICLNDLQTFANTSIVISIEASLLKRGSVSSIIYATGNMVSILVLATFLVPQPWFLDWMVDHLGLRTAARKYK